MSQIKLRADRTVSRRQVTVELHGERLLVTRCEGAQPVIFNGAPSDRFAMGPGDVFVVADTQFRFAIDRSGSGTGEPDSGGLLHTYSVPQGLSLAGSSHASQWCLRALAELPALLKLDLDTEQTLARIAEMLTVLLGHTLRVSAWRAATAVDDSSGTHLSLLGSVGGAGIEHPPSRRLAGDALGQPESVHVFDWQVAAPNDPAVTRPSDNVRWSMIAPIVLCPAERYLLYVEGISPVRTRTEVQELQQLVSAVTRQYLLSARAQRLRGQVGQFFSPALRRLLLPAASAAQAPAGAPGATAVEGDPLARRRVEATVMFFDLRGFSRAGEAVEERRVPDEEVDQRLLAHHELLEGILGTVADAVFQTGGIIIDFQGDAALACWGAPLPMRDHAASAARAARQIIERLHAMPKPFADNGRPTCGIGLTSGPVVAGRFHASPDAASEGLVKYSVMGTTVNRAARLEGLTKKVGVPVLMSESVHERLPAGDPPRRFVARVVPAGMQHPVDLYELVLPAEIGGSGVTAEGIAQYEQALGHFMQSRLDAARACLRHAALRGDDRVVEFLEQHVLRYRHEGLPPGFDGILRFEAK
ncbi:MAG TPA: adenylate/guanylate cyclase domain-containing protein [Phycisphaerae bacterium]